MQFLITIYCDFSIVLYRFSILRSNNSRYLVRNVIIAADHAGVILKKHISKYLLRKGFKVNDIGTNNLYKSVDYPDYAKKLVKKMNKKKMGILICGTGIGMSITANRFDKIRAALPHNQKASKLSREHNNSNVIILGAKLINFKKAKKMVDIFLTTKFSGGRHLRRINKI